MSLINWELTRIKKDAIKEAVADKYIQEMHKQRIELQKKGLEEMKKHQIERLEKMSQLKSFVETTKPLVDEVMNNIGKDIMGDDEIKTEQESFEDYCKRTGFGQAVPSPDPVNHPPHYTSHPSGVECIQITEHMNFCVGNAVKYLWRAELKKDVIEDLQKAIWYINREINRREDAAAALKEEHGYNIK